MKLFRVLLSFGLISACPWLSGCKDKDEIKVYRVSKAEQGSPPPQSPASAGLEARGMPPVTVPMGSGAPQAGQPQITDTPPPDWAAQPLSSMRLASYLVKGDNGAIADISLVALAGTAGGILDNVNRWLSQLGRPAITADQLAQMARRLPSPLGEVTVVDLEGLPAGADAAKDGRIIAGIVSGDTGTFFFKMRGSAALAGSQKPAFVQWIGTVRMAGTGSGPSQP
jgi:hypothetical protein